MLVGCDILIIYSSDAEEWCQYLQDLFLSSRHVHSQKMLTYRLGPKTSFSAEDLSFFLRTRCIVVLLSAELVQCFCQPALLPLLQRAFHPPHRVVRLLCGVQDSKEFLDFFPDWAHWQELTCDDEPETYVAAVRKAISEVGEKDILPMSILREPVLLVPFGSSAVTMEQGSALAFWHHEDDDEDSGCDSVTDTETEDEKVLPYSKQQSLPSKTSPGNLMVVQPDRIRCGAETTVYVIVKCKLDERVTTEAEFSPEDSPSIRVEAKLENEYTVSMKAPNQRDEELPTLLHFAAKYGLKNLTALLLTCPGALQAYSVANKHGHYPNTIAEKHGFRDLRQFIDEYVETVDMLKSHIKEELMQGEEADSVYESMAHLSTDLLMKCSLNPGCDEELYESMATFVPAATEDLYVEMLQASTSNPMPRDGFSRTTKDSMIRKFLEGDSVGMSSLEREVHHLDQEEDVYHTVDDDEASSVDLANRPPVPVPRPEASASGTHQLSDNEPYISKGKCGRQ
ncbi:hypothetical protein EI555_003420 [Monodon monoceros]|uniref:Phosphoinositide 3-kinase adapter protein 1 n=1 Tax=Monodon monoceros TaxID=40151 RepID=A0A4V5P830_MONMO|nr:hypothetical protein EI555_003420 [Monodon monoceros]